MRTGTAHSEGIVNIGQSICIRGELTGNEDLTIEGQVEGKIALQEHNLTIGPKGRIQAEVMAASVVIQGEVNGNIRATDRVELAETGRVTGDIVSPRIVIADGARFKGSVDMSGGTKHASGQKASPRARENTAAPLIRDDGQPGTSRAVARG
ncbi:MAG: polymer-forming cytoskeletal protein [Acidobacteriota bacterium]